MQLQSLDHCNIETAHLAETVRFYTELLGMHEGPRPAVGVPGAWLYVGERAVLHVNQVSSARAHSTGPIHHVAFSAGGFDETKAELEAAKCPYEVLVLPEPSTIAIIYVVDPNGVRIELNCRR